LVAPIESLPKEKSNVAPILHDEEGRSGSRADAVGSHGHVWLGHPCRCAGVAGRTAAGHRRRLHQQCAAATAANKVIVGARARPAQAPAASGGEQVRSRPFPWNF